MVNKKVPIGVKIISILYYISAIALLILGIFAFVGARLIDTIMPSLETLSSGMLIAFGIIFIVIAVLSFFIARYLWKAKNWARIVTIILSIIGVIFSIVALVSLNNIGANIVSLVIDLAIVIYLLFAKEVKKMFA